MIDTECCPTRKSEVRSVTDRGRVCMTGLTSHTHTVVVALPTCVCVCHRWWFAQNSEHRSANDFVLASQDVNM